MNKKITLGVLIILVLFLFNTFRERDIDEIIGTDIMDINYNNLKIRYNGGLGIKTKEIETRDIEKINSLLKHIKACKFRRIFRSKFDVGTLKSYYIILESEEDKFLHIYTMGYKYIAILDEYADNFKSYKILKNDLSLDFLNEFFYLLAKENNNNSTKNDIVANNTMDIIEGESEGYIAVDNYGSSIKIPISSIPELEAYLSEFSKEEKEVEINRIITDVLNLSDDFVYIDLRYACGTKLSNHILIKIREGKIETKLLSAASILKDYKISSNKEKVMFIFQRNEGVKVYRNSIKIVKLKDLTEMESKYIQSNNLNQYIWPFESYGWSDNDNIFIEIPDIGSIEYEELEMWLDQEYRNSKAININLSK